MWRRFFILFLCLAICLAAEDNVHENEVEDSRPLSAIRLPAELSLPSNMITLLASAGAVVLGIAGVAVIISLVLPMFGLRACNLFNTCAPSSSLLDNYAYNAVINPSAYNYDAVSPYSAQYVAAATARDPSSGTYSTSSTNYRKRSLDYVGPILKLLSTTYDKYAAPRIQNARHVRISEEPITTTTTTSHQQTPSVPTSNTGQAEN